MVKITLIVITGLPGTGKTTLGKKLATEFNLPFISKDEIKESLFDNLGWQDLKWSKKIGGASLELMYLFAETILKTKKSLIIETNFNPQFANLKLLTLKKKYSLSIIQIRCITDGQILFDRFSLRAHSNKRHPGHIDSENLEEWKPILFKGKIEALNIGGELIDFDTNNFKNVTFKKLVKLIRLKIKNTKKNT